MNPIGPISPIGPIRQWIYFTTDENLQQRRFASRFLAEPDFGF